MKTLSKGLLIAVTTALTVSVRAQVSVESDGCVKVGNLSNAKNVSGNSLDVAVNKVYMYMAPNGSGSFSIYNNSQAAPDPGPIIVVPGLSTDESRIVGGSNDYNQPTYIVPLNAGRLILGTSAVWRTSGRRDRFLPAGINLNELMVDGVQGDLKRIVVDA